MTPRSTLHALEPMGQGTAQCESLLSYFCRLAVSHSVSTTDLAKFVVDRAGHDIRRDFVWQQRNLSGVGESARTWAAWLSELTGVGNLDALTLSAWSAVLPSRGLAPRRSHWCPHCLREDKESGSPPYFRLSWEVGPVQACYRHKVALVETCPHCNEVHVRHHGGIVVPGWCTRCGGFLGDADTIPAEPPALWVARQVEDWIAHQMNTSGMPEATTVLATLDALILGLDAGRYASFARRIGQAKSTVHGWLKKGGQPSLVAYLGMALHAGLSLDHVIRGDFAGWKPPTPAEQLVLDLGAGTHVKRDAPREHDWSAMRKELEGYLKLPDPISVAEAGRRLGVDDRHLYLRANDLARSLGERWKQHMLRQKTLHRDLAKSHLRAAYPEITNAGRPFNLTEVRQVVPAAVLSAVEGMFGLIQEVRDEPG